MKSGIYTITNIFDGRVFVGSSKNLAGRWRSHRSRLNCYKVDVGEPSSTPQLQAAWIKHGEEAFEFQIVELAPVEALSGREQVWLDLTGAADLNRSYNVHSRAAVRREGLAAQELIAARENRCRKRRERAVSWAEFKKSVPYAPDGVHPTRRRSPRPQPV